MREAVIVSTAGISIGKAYRGAFNNTTSQAMGAAGLFEVLQQPERLQTVKTDNVR